MNDLLSSLDPLLLEMEEFARENRVPILEPEGRTILSSLIEIHGFERILEIGSAIGFSAIHFCRHPQVTVTTVERDPQRADLAKGYIAKAGLEPRIRLLFEDALTMDVTKLDSVDLLFIDAAKGQNLPLFQKFSPLVRSGGAVVIDNLFFHGFVLDPETIISRDRRQMVHKIQQFIDFIRQEDRFVTRIEEAGDGIGICIKK